MINIIGKEEIENQSEREDCGQERQTGRHGGSGTHIALLRAMQDLGALTQSKATE